MGEDQLDDLELEGLLTFRILDGISWDFNMDVAKEKKSRRRRQDRPQRQLKRLTFGLGNKLFQSWNKQAQVLQKFTKVQTEKEEALEYRHHIATLVEDLRGLRRAFPTACQLPSLLHFLFKTVLPSCSVAEAGPANS